MFKKIQELINSALKQEYTKALILYLLANIIGQGVVLFSSSLFTRMMSKSDFGLVNTYSTWVLVLNTFICFNLFISVRTAYIDFKEDYDNYNSSILLLSILIGIVMTCLICGATQLAGKGIGLHEVFLACVQSVALNIVNLSLAIQSMKNEYRSRAFMIVAPNISHILASVFLMLVFSSNLYIAKITGNAIGLFIFGIINSFIIFFKARPKIKLRYWSYALKISIPSIFNTLSDLILMQSDRLMLTAMINAEETAEYSIVYNVSSIIVIIYQAINGAWVPWFFKKVENDDRKDTIRYQKLYLLLFSVVTCGMITISPELIKILSRSDYWNGIRYAAPLAIASYLIFLYSFFTIFLLYKKRTPVIAVNTIVTALLNLVLNYLLIPKYQAIGAVIATTTSYCLLFLLHLFAVFKDGKQFFSIKTMLINLVAVIVWGVLGFLTRDIWALRYTLLLVGLILFYILLGKRIFREFGLAKS